jgi:lysine-N-methylase
LPIPSKRLQPRSYHAFRCIGAECEDTCCIGWLVNIDKTTYESYQRVEDPELGPRLRELVSIYPASTSDNDYARISLNSSGCPFLTEGLCGIQNKLGEEYLSTVCAKFPRAMTVVDDVLQRSLDLGCPEAARLVLLDPAPMEFDEEEGLPYHHGLGELSALVTADEASARPYRYFREIRAFVIELLQHRAYPLWKRVIILGTLCDQLEQLSAAGQNAQVPECLQWFRSAVRDNLLDEPINAHRPQPVLQLGILLELIVARMTVDYISPRFISCYKEFKEGIDWKPESSMEEIGARYATAMAQYYAPFLSQHEYMLEHYLVNYVHQTLFPLAPQQHRIDPNLHRAADSMRDQCMLMMVYYAVAQTLLIGLAVFHNESFGPKDVIRVVQAVAKSFQHSLSFPERAIQILAEKGVKNCVSLGVLIRN